MCYFFLNPHSYIHLHSQLGFVKWKRSLQQVEVKNITQQLFVKDERAIFVHFPSLLFFLPAERI